MRQHFFDDRKVGQGSGAGYTAVVGHADADHYVAFAVFSFSRFKKLGKHLFLFFIFVRLQCRNPFLGGFHIIIDVTLIVVDIGFDGNQN